MAKANKLICLTRGATDVLLAPSQVWEYILPTDVVKEVNLGGIEMSEEILPVPGDSIQKIKKVYGFVEGCILIQAYTERRNKCNVEINTEIAKAFHKKELPPFSFNKIEPIVPNPAPKSRKPRQCGIPKSEPEPTAAPVNPLLKVFVVSYYNVPGTDVLSELEVSKMRFVPVSKVALRFKQTLSEHHIKNESDDVEEDILNAFPKRTKDLFGKKVLVTIRT